MGFPEGNAVVYCQNAFGTTYGKTAHGLIRRTARYNILSVVDSFLAGRDAGEMLDGIHRGIPIAESVSASVEHARRGGRPATHLVIGLAPDGGVMSGQIRNDVTAAVDLGLNVDSGLHDFMADDEQLTRLAEKRGVVLRDVRKCPPQKELHFFSGKIGEVSALKVAVLGTDSAVGKRTTAWILLDALRAAGFKTEMIGTGQTAWMQGVRYGIILDSLVNDFVAGEIEHAVWQAWDRERPDIILLEGQGSLMNPAYPGGFELLAAGRPDMVVLQHAPARKDYDGFPGHPIHPLDKQIQIISLLSEKPVVAVTVNHEGLNREETAASCAAITRETGLPAGDILRDGPDAVLAVLTAHLKR